MAKTEWVIFHLNFEDFYDWVTEDIWFSTLLPQHAYPSLLKLKRDNNAVAPSFGDGIKYDSSKTLGDLFEKKGINYMPK